jgi:hypothetical protein
MACYAHMCRNCTPDIHAWPVYEFRRLAVENKILQHFLSFFSDDNDKPLSPFFHILMD